MVAGVFRKKRTRRYEREKKENMSGDENFSQSMKKGEDYAVRAIADGSCSLKILKIPPVPLVLQEKTAAVQILSEEIDTYGMNIVTVEAGGGGNCFFHSVAYVLNAIADKAEKEHTQESVREMAANAVVPENVDAILMDMAGVYVASSDAEMVPSAPRPPPQPNTFDAMQCWNGTRDSAERRLATLRDAIKTSGNFFWGDVTTAALLEPVLGVNIVTFAKRGSKLGATRDYVGHVADLGRENSVKRNAKDPEGRSTVMLYNVGNLHWKPACIICRLVKGGEVVGYRRTWLVPPSKFHLIEQMF